jgi:hypothetical protein
LAIVGGDFQTVESSLPLISEQLQTTADNLKLPHPSNRDPLAGVALVLPPQAARDRRVKITLL